MQMKVTLFGRRRAEARPSAGRPRYVSSLQKDVQKYEGWSESSVSTDYTASKSVHTIITLGYMEYSDGVLVLTDKGRMLMRNVNVQPASSADGTSF